MTAPKPTEPNSANTPPARQGANRLAITSVLLALGAAFVAVLGYNVTGFSNPFPEPAYNAVFFGSYVVSLVASIAAIVTGALALRRARQYSPEHALRGTAILGLALGILVTVPLIFPGGFLVLLTYACNVNGACA